MQGTGVRSLVQEDSRVMEQLGPGHHNGWATVHKYWRPPTMSPRSPREVTAARSCPPRLDNTSHWLQLEKACSAVKAQRSWEQAQVSGKSETRWCFVSNSFVKQRYMPPIVKYAVLNFSQKVSRVRPVSPALFCGYTGEQHKQDHGPPGEDQQQASDKWSRLFSKVRNERKNLRWW